MTATEKDQVTKILKEDKTQLTRWSSIKNLTSYTNDEVKEQLKLDMEDTSKLQPKDIVELMQSVMESSKYELLDKSTFIKSFLMKSAILRQTNMSKKTTLSIELIDQFTNFTREFIDNSKAKISILGLEEVKDKLGDYDFMRVVADNSLSENIIWWNGFSKITEDDTGLKGKKTRIMYLLFLTLPLILIPLTLFVLSQKEIILPIFYQVAILFSVYLYSKNLVSLYFEVGLVKDTKKELLDVVVSLSKVIQVENEIVEDLDIDVVNNIEIKVTRIPDMNYNYRDYRKLEVDSPKILEMFNREQRNIRTVNLNELIEESRH